MKHLLSIEKADAADLAQIIDATAAMKEGFLPGSLAVLVIATVIVTAVGLIVFRRRNLRA